MTESLSSSVLETRAKRFLKDFGRILKAALGRPAYAAFFASPAGPTWACSRLAGKSPSVEILDPEKASAVASSLRGTRISLPRYLFMARDVALPGVDPVELEGMLQFELQALFPMPPDELSWDWVPVRARDDGYTVCRVVAIQTVALVETLGALGLHKTRVAVEPSTVSLANFFAASSPSWPSERAVLVALSSAAADFVIVGPNGIESDRAVVRPASGFEPREVASELSVFLSMSQAPDALSPVKVYLADCPSFDEVAVALSAETGLPVERFPQAPFVHFGDAPPSTDALLAVGAALGPLLQTAHDVSFVPPDIRLREIDDVRAHSAFAVAVLVAMVVLFAWLALVARAHRVASYVEKLDSRAHQIGPEARTIDAKRERLAAVKRQLAGQGKVLDILVALYRVTPPDIFLTKVEISPARILTIQGHAQWIYRPHAYAVLLEDHEIFGRYAPNGVSSQQRTEAGKRFISFTIIRDLSATEDR